MNTSPWRKSSRSGNNGGACVEARTLADRFELRDGKLGDESPILGLSGREYVSLLAEIKTSRYDG